MKFSTILNEGQAHPVLVVTNQTNRCEHCLDLVRFNSAMESVDSGGRYDRVPPTLLKIIEGWQEAAVNLRRIHEQLLQFRDRKNTDVYSGSVNRRIDKLDENLFQPALVAPESVRWLPHLPDVPLFITFHGNGIQLWRDRLGTPQSRAAPRVPACQLHPATSLLGH